MAFNKQNLLTELELWRDRIQTENNFTFHDGYAQVTGKCESVNREYGKWDTLKILIDQIEGGYLGYGEKK